MNNQPHPKKPVTPANSTIYLEADEDITSAIDKLVKSGGKQVQVVAAKRSTLIQSRTNLRLLKKSAEDAGKSLVLVTSDRLATNLASRIGLPVASQVGETPQVPSDLPALTPDEEVVLEDEVAPTLPAVAPVATPEVVEAATLTHSPVIPPSSSTRQAVSKEKKVPNFSLMQKRIMWGAVVALGIALLLGLNYYLTSAKLTIFAKAIRIDASFDFSADPGGATGPTTIPATLLTIPKSLAANVQASGKKDVGTPAKGTMNLSNCYDNQPHTLVAGTRFQSPDGKVFRSSEDATVPGGTGSFFGCTVPGKVSVSVTADANGDSYNLASGTKYAIPALPPGQQAGITASGGQMSGGISKTVPVILQADVDKARQVALDAAKADIQKDFTAKAGKDQLAIVASLRQTVASATSNPDVGAEAPQASMAIQVTFTELAVDRGKLKELTKAQEQKQVGAQNQIYDDGSGSLVIKSANDESPPTGAQSFHAVTTAYSGAKIDKEALANSLKGKKYGEAADMAAHLPGVERADLSISPAWATSMPGITSHIHIIIKVANLGG